jgi:hypothetical protein
MKKVTKNLPNNSTKVGCNNYGYLKKNMQFGRRSLEEKKKAQHSTWKLTTNRARQKKETKL